ncbi:MAG TPA: ComEC/Rec2 family competence protein [Opitutaceae bacterium]|nr:ComEC/Rec2 family competence protein [Opitutaceae bacterium]
MPLPPTRAPLLWLVLPFAGGIALASDLAPPADGGRGLLGCAAAAAAAAAWVGRHESPAARCGWALLLAAGAAAAGFVHAHRQAPQLAGWDDRPPRELDVTLRIDRLFASDPRGRMQYGLGQILAAPELAPELAGLRVYFSTVRRADRTPPLRNGVYRVRGVVSPLPATGGRADGFEDYLRNLGVAARFQRGQVLAVVRPPGWLDRLAQRARGHFAGHLRLGLERRPELASLQVAMLLGEKASLSPEQEAAFLRSGTFHIFSVSGLHVAAIASAIQAVLLLLRTPRLLRVAVGLLVLWFYVLVVGANPPAVRAFIMVAFLLARGLCGLPGNPFAALCAAALTTLLLDPRQLFGSGFQLSYLVVGALVLMGAPLAENWLAAWRPWADLPETSWNRWQMAWRWCGRKALGALAVTVVAVVGSTPASIAAFGLFTPGALLANLVVVPLASLALVAGFISILGGLLGLPGVSIFFNHAAAVTIIVMDRLAAWSTLLPLAHFPAEYRAPWLAAPSAALPLVLMLVGAACRWRPAAGGYWLPVAGVVLILLACVRLG